MAHAVDEGVVTVLKIVTPGCYWIKCGSCRGFSKIPESIRSKFHSEDFYPSVGEKVFCQDSDGFFYQGTVCCRGEFPLFASMQARRYTVKLDHTFQVKDFDRCHIYPTFNETSVACESAHLVSLYNVLPSLPPPEFASPIESKNSKACLLFIDSVRNWYQLREKVVLLVKNRLKFRYEQLAVVNGSLYGKLSYFNQSREINIKDILVSENIAVRSSFRFECVVQSLMSRTLHSCSNPLPLYSPNRPIIKRPTTELKPREENKLDLSKFRVYKDDVQLHEGIWTHTSLNILFTGRGQPLKNGIFIRYVAPSNEIVLGTVFNPKVSIYELCERDPPPGNLIKKFIHRQYNSNCNYEIPLSGEMPPLSSDEEDSESRHSHDFSLFAYNMDEAVKRFTRRGGILEEFSSLSPLLVNSKILVELVDEAFNAISVDTLEDWQLVCLPSMMSKRNVLVLGRESQRKLSTSIVSTLSLMKYNEQPVNNTPKSIGPTSVIFVNSFKRADRAAKLCCKISNCKVIVSTYSQITESQQKEMKEGCDILITTPSNWVKFTDLQCIDRTRLRHVVFDELDKLNKRYGNEMDVIFRKLKSEKHLQVILLSNVWGSFLVDFIQLIGPTTRCVIDMALACFCYRLSPNVVIVGNDWDVLLSSIINNDRTSLRLLLCANSHEVLDIESRMTHLDNVLYVHENDDKNTVIERINYWKSNSEVFLIASDLLFNELDFIDKANLLVSWKQNPCSHSTLDQRLMSIRGHKLRERRVVPVYIFSNRDNLEELVFIKNTLENVKRPVFLGGDLDECIESSFKEAESLKTGDHCPSFCSFGTCELTPLCPQRHEFRPQDIVHVVRNNAFLEISMVTLHSAFHATVRIHDVISNQELNDEVISSFKSKLPEIEAGLNQAFEINSEESTNRVDHSTNDVVGTMFGSNLRRVKIINECWTNDGNDEDIRYEVLFMDYDEPNATIPKKDCFLLPPDVASFPRDIVDVFVSKLAPVDFNSNWAFETRLFWNNYTELMVQDSNNHLPKLLAGHVDVVIERKIIVNSIIWCRVEEESPTYVVHGSMKEAVLVSKYVRENPEHFNILSKLAVDCGKPSLTCTPIEEFGFRLKFPDGFTDAVVSAFDDPGLFYVQLSSEKDKLQALETRLNSSMNESKTRLSVVVENELCCVEIDGSWNRAIILSRDSKRNPNDSSSLLVTVLCVDYGDTHPAVSCRDLFCLPNEFIEGIPFFAIECRLVGVSPFEKQWSDSAVVEFESQIRDPDNVMEPMSVKFCGVFKENRFTKHYQHQVVLRRAFSDHSINQLLVRRGLAMWDQETVDLLITREKHQRKLTRRRNPIS